MSEVNVKKDKIIALSELKKGEKGKIVRVASRGVIRKRITEMGITSGTEVQVKGFAPFGDPMVLGVMGYRLGLRKSEAQDIFVEVI
ncbi:MAG TPA: FeoA family protein [Pseudobacteroides sp.]|uniref:FeoA family protein n=1 Tax=Pseudobacteroides sp. TaxID=1968840 RepID=UPI002F9401F5